MQAAKSRNALPPEVQLRPPAHFSIFLEPLYGGDHRLLAGKVRLPLPNDSLRHSILNADL
jgi:hypothetical protein